MAVGGSSDSLTRPPLLGPADAPPPPITLTLFLPLSAFPHVVHSSTSSECLLAACDDQPPDCLSERRDAKEKK